jgi:hypothetical protein
MQDRIWICRDGRQIPVSRLAESHLLSILRLMDRNPSWRRDYRDRLEIELIIRNIRRTAT